ncbi:hypothetical protein [Ramlibacter sp.]|uniref:hypothetical protein n=1 Tax=Ramlibacter sp. TaxID=1917967 RepID=UPI003D1279F3
MRSRRRCAPRAQAQALVQARARANWGKARSAVNQVLLPSLDSRLSGGHQHINESYWLEAIDPRHRSWGHIEMSAGKSARELLAEWMNDRKAQTFWEWCTAQGLDALPSVQYLAPDQRWKYMVQFSTDKKLTTLNASKSPEPLSTAAMSTAVHGPNFAIWVASGTGVFFTYSHTLSQFHHSSFLGGRPLLCGGEWMSYGGKLVYLSHRTGHYQSSAEDLVLALKKLEGKVDLSRTLVHLMRVDGHTTKAVKYVWAEELLRTNPEDSKMIPPEEFTEWQRELHANGLNAGQNVVFKRLEQAIAQNTFGEWEALGWKGMRTLSGMIFSAAEKRALRPALVRCTAAGITFKDNGDYMEVLLRGTVIGGESRIVPSEVNMAAFAAAGLKLDDDSEGDCILKDIASSLTLWAQRSTLPRLDEIAAPVR